MVQLEMRYWDDHRRLVGQPEKGAFLQTLVDLHSATFGITPEQARAPGEWRLLAANTVDGITSKWSTDVEGDWAKLEEYLSRCYRSIRSEVQSPRSGAPSPSAD